MYFIIPLVALLSAMQLPGHVNSTRRNIDLCKTIESCSSCLLKSYCTWCVNKSVCSKQNCGNDLAIYPDSIQSLFSGKNYCPRVLAPEPEQIFAHDKKYALKFKVTQMHYHMAITEWKCKFNVGSEEEIVDAQVLADIIWCDLFEFKVADNKPFAEGSVSLLWDRHKNLDGVIPFKICRCDLNPSCVACT